MMKSYHILFAVVLPALIPLITVSCSVSRNARNGTDTVTLAIPESPEEDEAAELVIDSLSGNPTGDPLLMNAIRESESGELYATDIIPASEVVAKFKSVAERNGEIDIAFDIRIPEQMLDSRWQLKFFPEIEMGEEHISLDPVYLTGRKYRERQLRGYQRYQKFIDSIILDSTYFIRKDQLEIFLQRNFPEVYRFRNDSSFVEDSFEDRWGATRKEVIRHYTRLRLKTRHARKWDSRAERFQKYVPDPMPDKGIRLDSIVSSGGMMVYSYTQMLKVSRNVRKLLLYLNGSLYGEGKMLKQIPPSDTLEFYITSLSSLLDHVERMKMKVISRQVSDRTKAFINFASASHEVDTAWLDNAAELARVGRCIDRIAGLKEMVLDSLVITSNCSPEGAFSYNRKLSGRRSRSIRDYVGRFLPDSLQKRVKTSSSAENWTGLCRRIESDTLIPPERKRQLLSLAFQYEADPDLAEKNLSVQPEYRYLRSRIYPELRTVAFDFYLHRPDMVKDTVHTSEPDTLYMNGLEAIRNMDYKRAVADLRPYKDYNAALACVLADYNHSALEILEELEEDASCMYLKAIVYSRLGLLGKAQSFLKKSISLDPAMKFRAGLDPELSSLTKNIK